MTLQEEVFALHFLIKTLLETLQDFGNQSNIWYEYDSHVPVIVRISRKVFGESVYKTVW